MLLPIRLYPEGTVGGWFARTGQINVKEFKEVTSIMCRCFGDERENVDCR
jgi:hypothetical protein